MKSSPSFRTNHGSITALYCDFNNAFIQQIVFYVRHNMTSGKKIINFSFSYNPNQTSLLMLCCKHNYEFFTQTEHKQDSSKFNF